MLIVDDLLATGGTARATVDLVKQLGGVVEGVAFLIELVALNGRTKLPGENIHAVLQYLAARASGLPKLILRGDDEALTHQPTVQGRGLQRHRDANVARALACPRRHDPHAVGAFIAPRARFASASPTTSRQTLYGQPAKLREFDFEELPQNLDFPDGRAATEHASADYTGRCPGRQPGVQ